MSRKVIFKSIARLEFDEAVAWYERQQSGLGAALDAEANSVLERARNHPEQFPKIAPRIRKARLRRFPYNIYFAETPDHIGVLGVYHAKRDPQKLRQRF